MSVENIKSLEARKEIARYYRVLNSIARELKFNYTKCDLDNNLLSGEKVFKYDKSVEEKLIYTELFDLEEGDKNQDYISISLESSERYSSNIRISGSYKDKAISEEVMENIIKYVWE